jgi:outer membrane protein
MLQPGKVSIILFLIIGSHGYLSAQSTPWTLKQCIDSAIFNNITILQDINTIELNRINLKQSKNNLLPSLNGSATEGLSVGRMINPITGLYETGTVWSTSAGISMSQNLFNGLQYLNSIKQNELIHRSSKYDLEDAKFNLTINIVNAYLQVLYTGEAIKIAANQVSADSTLLQTTSDMVYVGKKTESDMLTVKSQLASDKYTVVNAASQWKIAKVNLQQFINIPVSETFDVDYNTSIEPAEKKLDDINNVYSQSLSFQPIVKSYALKTESADYAVRVARGAYYPQLMLKGSVGTDYSSYATQSTTTTTSTIENIGYLQSNPTDLVEGNVPHQTTKVNNYPFGNQMGDNFNGTFSIGLTVPILNYLQVRNNVKKQQVNLNNAVLSENLTKINLRKTIEQVYTTAENSQAQYSSANEEVEANKAAYDLSVVKFNQGKMIASDLIVLKNSYQKALSDYLQAKYGLLFNTKILDYYRGIPITF